MDSEDVSCPRLYATLRLVEEAIRRSDVEDIQLRSFERAHSQIRHGQMDMPNRIPGGIELRDGTAME